MHVGPVPGPGPPRLPGPGPAPPELSQFSVRSPRAEGNFNDRYIIHYYGYTGNGKGRIHKYHSRPRACGTGEGCLWHWKVPVAQGCLWHGGCGMGYIYKYIIIYVHIKTTIPSCHVLENLQNTKKLQKHRTPDTPTPPMKTQPHP